MNSGSLEMVMAAVRARAIAQALAKKNFPVRCEFSNSNRKIKNQTARIYLRLMVAPKSTPEVVGCMIDPPLR